MIEDRNILNLFRNGEERGPSEVASALDVTRQTAYRRLRSLVEEGLLHHSGKGRASRYRLADPEFRERYEIAGLEEDRVWRDAARVEPICDLTGRSLAGFQYAMTELVNNAIDHSGASEVEIRVWREGAMVHFQVSDPGIGVLRHLRDFLELESELEALQELSKGKTTTQPDRHTGEGIFFTSKLAHRFLIESGSLRWVVDNDEADMAVGVLEPPVDGTTVRFSADPDRMTDLTELFAQFTDDFEFTRTRTVIKLFAYGTDFISRSQAKRLVHGLERFRIVELDFSGIELIGQGFVDEVFRVWAQDHPNVELRPSGMSPPVEFMVARGLRGQRLLGPEA